MKNMIKITLACLALVSTAVNAALIDGTLAVGGAYNATGGTDLSDATDLTINTVYGNPSSGDFTSTINLMTLPGTGGSASIAAFLPVTNFLSIGGWQLDLSTLEIVDQTASVLNLSGTGIMSGNGFDATPVNWSFSSQSVTSYSMTATTVVPVPAAVWLFGSGLIGLVAVSRRKV